MYIFIVNIACVLLQKVAGSYIVGVITESPCPRGKLHINQLEDPEILSKMCVFGCKDKRGKLNQRANPE